MKKSSSPQFTPEQELLLWSIRVDHTKDQQIGEILKAGVDWKYIRETAIQHGIIPLLYKRLKDDMEDLVPAEILSEFRNLFMANAINNIQMTQQLLQVLDLLADAGVEAMPFKGPALAIQAYGDLSMRSFCDLDILIHKNDFDQVYKLLVNSGFTPYVLIDSEIIKKFILLQKDFPFSGPNIHIEIHWKITEKFISIPLNIEQIWNQNRVILLFNREIKTFNPEDDLILLCIHGLLHFWQELKWISDLSYLINNYPDLNWDKIIHLTENIGIKRIVTIGFFLAQEYGGVILPLKIRKLFTLDLFFHNITDIISNNFFLERKIILTPPHYYLKSRERIRDHLNYTLYYFSYEILIPNQYDFKYITLPSPLFPFYVVVRPLRLFIEHLTTLIWILFDRE